MRAAREVDGVDDDGGDDKEAGGAEDDAAVIGDAAEDEDDGKDDDVAVGGNDTFKPSKPSLKCAIANRSFSSSANTSVAAEPSDCGQHDIQIIREKIYKFKTVEILSKVLDGACTTFTESCPRTVTGNEASAFASVQS